MSEPDATHWHQLLNRVYRDRKWLVVHTVVVAASHSAHKLTLSGGQCFAMGARRGTGDIDPTIPSHNLDIPASQHMMGALREGLQAYESLPAAATSIIDAWDPEHQAQVIAPLFSQLHHVAGRPVWGARHPKWCDLEDKVIIDALWDEAGITRAPVEIVENRPEALLRASARMDRGQGTVWALDASQGWHGGAAGTFWSLNESDYQRSLAQVSGRADCLRVMPFLEGVPCSIHGWVFATSEVIALHPCEMLVLREHAPRRFHYASTSTHWHPNSADADTLRSIALRMGHHLKEHFGYRGAFTIDGVMTADGFLPTELNPRFGAALGALGVAAGIDLYPLHLAVVQGVEEDYQPKRLEALIREQALRWPIASFGYMINGKPCQTPRKLFWIRTEEGLQVQQTESPTTFASGELGPGPTGSYLRVKVHRDHLDRGELIAPWVARILAAAEQQLQLGIPPLHPPIQVR